MTQQEKVLLLLRQLGNQGVNSYDLTYKYAVKQAPTRINELKDLGYVITTRNRSNRSVDYILLSEPKQPKKEKPVSKDGTWDFSSGSAVWIENKQASLL